MNTPIPISITPPDLSYFETTDFYLSSVLATLGYRLGSLDATNPSRVFFLFERAEGLDAVIEAYHKRELRLEPMEFALQQKLLKNRLYTTLRK